MAIASLGAGSIATPADLAARLVAADSAPQRALGSVVEANAADGNADAIERARGVKKAYSQFVGESFYGSMLKAMRSSVGTPAYFHGGHAEEVFQGRLDQQWSSDLAATSGDRLAGAFFEKQFPHEAALLREADAAAGLADLDRLAAR